MAQRSVWMWGLIASVVTAAVGVAVNVATDWKTSLWAWLAVAVLAVFAGIATVRFTQVSGQPASGERVPSAPGPGQPDTAEHRSVHNQVSGRVHGTVIQAGTIHGGVHHRTEADKPGPPTRDHRRNGG